MAALNVTTEDLAYISALVVMMSLLVARCASVAALVAGFGLQNKVA